VHAAFCAFRPTKFAPERFAYAKRAWLGMPFALRFGEWLHFQVRLAMDTFAPEFSKFWLPEAEGLCSDTRRAGRDDDSCAQQAALEELAERVSAARSVV